MQLLLSHARPVLAKCVDRMSHDRWLQSKSSCTRSVFALTICLKVISCNSKS